LRQVGYLLELYRDARSSEYKISPKCSTYIKDHCCSYLKSQTPTQQVTIRTLTVVGTSYLKSKLTPEL